MSIQAADLIETELLLLRHKVIDLAEQFEQSSNVPLILFLCVGGKHGIGICHWRSAPFQPPTQRCMQCTKFTKWQHGDVSCEIRSGHYGFFPVCVSRACACVRTYGNLASLLAFVHVFERLFAGAGGRVAGSAAPACAVDLGGTLNKVICVTDPSKARDSRTRIRPQKAARPFPLRAHKRVGARSVARAASRPDRARTETKALARALARLFLAHAHAHVRARVLECLCGSRWRFRRRRCTARRRSTSAWCADGESGKRQKERKEMEMER